MDTYRTRRTREPLAGGLYRGLRACQRALPGLLLIALAACASTEKKPSVADQVDASYKMAIAFLNEDRPSLALRELARATQLAPNDPRLPDATGMAYWRKADLVRAEESFRRAVAVSPDYSASWNNLGALYMQQERWAEAVDALEHVVADVFYPTPAWALTNLGWSLYNLGEIEAQS